MKQLIVFAGISLLLLSGNLNAHHARAATFQVDEEIQVEGVITEFSFRNPHTLIRMDVTGEDGSITQWVVEGGSATAYRGQGWDRQSVNQGDLIRVTGNPTLDGSPMITLDALQVVDSESGETTWAYNSETSSLTAEDVLVPQERALHLPNGAPNLTGVWTGRVSPYASPRDPQFSYNDLGKARQAAFKLENDPQVFCERPGLIRQAGITGYAVRLTQLEDRILLEYEEYGFTRTIFFDDRELLGVHSHFGDSVAHYEGDSLVIETTNLLPDLASPEGNRLSDQTAVIERFWRADEPEYGAILHTEITIHDPILFTEDYVMTNIKVAVPEFEFIENACEPPMRERNEVHPYMSFFLTSENPGDGANLGGLEGADAHCAALASRVGQDDKTWRAYLSTTGENGVDARDRIGDGPWYNAKGELVALDTEHLHSDNWLTKLTALDERGRELTQITSTAQDDGVNSRHDILTGSLLDGTASNAEEDTTCSNWTSNSEGSALIGHADRRGGGINPTSWNYAHPTRGCSPHLLATSDGAGFFYCFATEE